MLSSQAQKLDSNARLLLQQAVHNPSLQQVFMFEKITLQKQLLDAYQVDGDTDSQYLRKLEVLRHKILYVDEILTFLVEEQDTFKQ